MSLSRYQHPIGNIVDAENVDPLSGLLSTLRSSSSGAGAAGKHTIVELGRTPFSDVTGRYQQTSGEGIAQAGPRPVPQASTSLFSSSMTGTWLQGAPNVSTGSLRLMR
ncbi:hypothetical protein Agub_g8524 [Astrephomene gubernaculifera]|uniref:Uncharacterized protein n=1 Tax=Astrephomene gubernaculifera TaxID=47775 RepID=A0AAD3DUJ1_9CHLO|nr:hypothetical protein Agub_g8524 [Astrephomene gubernaculifera]